jgi:hypothetical protein
MKNRRGGSGVWGSVCSPSESRNGRAVTAGEGVPEAYVSGKIQEPLTSGRLRRDAIQPVPLPLCPVSSHLSGHDVLAPKTSEQASGPRTPEHGRARTRVDISLNRLFQPAECACRSQAAARRPPLPPRRANRDTILFSGRNRRCCPRFNARYWAIEEIPEDV